MPICTFKLAKNLLKLGIKIIKVIFLTSIYQCYGRKRFEVLEPGVRRRRIPRGHRGQLGPVPRPVLLVHPVHVNALVQSPLCVDQTKIRGQQINSWAVVVVVKWSAYLPSTSKI